MKSRTASGICRFGLIGSAWLAVVGCGRASGPNEEVEIQTSAITLSGANLDLQVSGNSCSANGSQTYLQVKNSDSSSVKLADITMKFWVNDTTGSAVVPQVAYGGCVTNAAGTCVHPVSNVTATASKFTGCGPDAQHQANWEITVSTTDTTSVSPGFTWSGIQTAVHLASYANFSPGSSTWYSPCGSGQPFHSDAHYSVYVKGELVVTNLGITPPGCRADQSLTVQVPPAMSPRAFALVASGALNLSERVTVKGPIANMGSTSTHIASDDKLVDVYTKPAVTVGARSVLQGRLRTGSSASVDSSASVVGGISSAFFEPPSTQTVRFDVPAGSLQDIVVDSDQTRVLAPGGYGRLLLRARARLVLSTGDYYFQHFDTAPTDAFVDSVFKLNERDGAVRIFVRDPFHVSQRHQLHEPAAGSRCWRCWGAATCASSGRSRAHSWPRKPTSLSLPLRGAEHTAGFFAKNVTVNADVVVKALPRQPHSCRSIEFRHGKLPPRAAHTASTSFGTRARRAPSSRVRRRSRPANGFSRSRASRSSSIAPSRSTKAKAAVQILSVSCPESVLAAGCTHDVMLEATQVGTRRENGALQQRQRPVSARMSLQAAH